MKELSIEEKAKAYDRVSKEVKDFFEGRQKMYSDVNQTLEYLFPELKESEDERIRKELLEHCKNQAKPYIQTGNKYPQIQSWIAWLEKQGEQNPTDKVEPKFKVGDWIANNEYNNFARVLEVNEQYRLDYCNTIGAVSIELIDTDYHLWTIQDAKDGDVLYFNDSTIVIFKDLYNATTFHSYCHIEDSVFSISQDNMPDWWEGEGFVPATKEQCDTLFAKMKEAGYEWDAEKKELKKIEQTIEIPFGAKDSELQEITYYIPKGFYAEIDDDKVVIKKGEKPTTWSEEDEMFVHGLIRGLAAKRDIHGHTTFSSDCIDITEAIDWLKSLKDKYTWKPSDEQMEALSTCLIKGEISYVGQGSILQSLYNKLKIL